MKQETARSIKIPEALYRKLKRFAEKDHRAIIFHVIQAIEQYLNGQEEAK
jgi:predicted transcriptional regulator